MRRGAEDAGLFPNHDIDFTLAATKTFQLGRPFISTVGMRNSQAAGTGFFGFTDGCANTVEASAVCLVTDWLGVAYEFRQKENPYHLAPGVRARSGR